MSDLDWMEPEYEPRTRLAQVKWTRTRWPRHPVPRGPVSKSEAVRRYGQPFLATGPNTKRKEK